VLKGNIFKTKSRSIQTFLPTTFINLGATSDLLYFIIKGKVQIMYLLEFVKVADPFVERKFMVL
jgi:hypothetical protein